MCHPPSVITLSGEKAVDGVSQCRGNCCPAEGDCTSVSTDIEYIQSMCDGRNDCRDLQAVAAPVTCRGRYNSDYLQIQYRCREGKT